MSKELITMYELIGWDNLTVEELQNMPDENFQEVFIGLKEFAKVVKQRSDCGRYSQLFKTALERADFHKIRKSIRDCEDNIYFEKFIELLMEKKGLKTKERFHTYTAVEESIIKSEIELKSEKDLQSYLYIHKEQSKFIY